MSEIHSLIYNPQDATGPIATRHDSIPAGQASGCGLRGLGAGDIGTVAGITENGHAATKRLADMGFIPGVRIQMLRPGRPCIIRINGTCMGVGSRYQESIRLHPEGCP